jgi:hypothetical protein
MCCSTIHLPAFPFLCVLANDRVPHHKEMAVKDRLGTNIGKVEGKGVLHTIIAGKCGAVHHRAGVALTRGRGRDGICLSSAARGAAAPASHAVYVERAGPFPRRAKSHRVVLNGTRSARAGCCGRDPVVLLAVGVAVPPAADAVCDGRAVPLARCALSRLSMSTLLCATNERKMSATYPRTTRETEENMRERATVWRAHGARHAAPSASVEDAVGANAG